MDEMEVMEVQEPELETEEAYDDNQDQDYDVPDTYYEEDPNSNAKLIAGGIAAGLAIGYGMKKLVDKTRQKIAEKKNGNPNGVKTHRRLKFRTPWAFEDVTVLTVPVTEVPKETPPAQGGPATESQNSEPKEGEAK